MKYTIKHFKALLIFVVPTLIITAVLFTLEPPTTAIFIGFIVLFVGACLTYFLGIRGVLKENTAAV